MDSELPSIGNNPEVTTRKVILGRNVWFLFCSKQVPQDGSATDNVLDDRLGCVQVSRRIAIQ